MNDMAPITSPEQQRFRAAIARFATGVTVITTQTDDGPAGMTASAVTSLSLNPVLLLICVSTHLPTHTALEHSQRFAVNVLGEGDESLARCFATPAENKFAGLAVDDAEGVPVLRDALAHFVCDVHERHPGGDHSIFIGAVRECAYVPDRRPLLYWSSEFGALHNPDQHLHDAYAWQASMSL